MKIILNLTQFTVFILLLTSCSQVKKSIANDSLLGSYQGYPTTVFEWSKLNIGKDDDTVDAKKAETIQIKQYQNGEMFIEDDDGTIIKLNNVQLANNGVTFNIPQQKITGSTKDASMQGNISGLGQCFHDEEKCDGVYDDTNKELTFSFEGAIQMEKDGESYNVPFGIGYYKLSKLK